MKPSTQAQKYAELLAGLGACGEAVAWSKGKTLEEAWATCERGDWMFWLVAKMVGREGWPTHQEVVLAACAVAETVLKHVPAGEDRPKNAIETTRAWCRGEATISQVMAAGNAAVFAANICDAAFAAAYAADAAYDVTYAAFTTYTAADDADTKNSSLAESAIIVRKMLNVRKELP
jgi:hypothetical protein